MPIDGFDYWLDLLGGQKTGFYLDQRPQHAAVAAVVRRMAAGRQPRVLDAFCNQGPFALHAARAGAAEVLGLDSARRTRLPRPGATPRAQRRHRPGSLEANVFDWLNDPGPGGGAGLGRDRPGSPAVRKVQGRHGRGLARIQGDQPRAMQRLAPGGMLAT